MIPQFSRISHHTNTTGITFSVPLSEDFTDGSWDTSHLALSEIGVDELNSAVYIRIGEEIKRFSFDECCNPEPSCDPIIAELLRLIYLKLKPIYIDKIKYVYRYVEVNTTNYVYIKVPCNTTVTPLPPVIIISPPSPVPPINGSDVKGWKPVRTIMTILTRNNKMLQIGPGWYWKYLKNDLYAFVLGADKIPDPQFLYSSNWVYFSWIAVDNSKYKLLWTPEQSYVPNQNAQTPTIGPNGWIKVNRHILINSHVGVEKKISPHWYFKMVKSNVFAFVEKIEDIPKVDYDFPTIVQRRTGKVYYTWSSEIFPYIELRELYLTLREPKPKAKKGKIGIYKI